MSGRVDLNADAAESSRDLELFPQLSSVNLACTAHAGDEALLLAALGKARELQLSAGAHPGYPDRENFGRLELNLPSDRILQLVADQLDLIGRLADRVGITLSHVKAHGALYHRLGTDVAVLRAVAAAAAGFRAGISLYLPAGPGFEGMRSELADVAVKPVAEGFPDREYMRDGSLAPRSISGSVISDPDKVAERAVIMASGRPFATADGGELCFRAETLCLHGDNPAAAGNAIAVRRGLANAGFTVGGLS